MERSVGGRQQEFGRHLSAKRAAKEGRLGFRRGLLAHAEDVADVVLPAADAAADARDQQNENDAVHLARTPSACELKSMVSRWNGAAYRACEGFVQDRRHSRLP